MNIFKDYEGDWAVFSCGIQKYLGRILERKEGTNEFVVGPIFDYVNEIHQDQEGKVGRFIMINPADLCISFDSIMTIFVSSVMKFSEMSDRDRHEYEKVIHEGVKNSLAARAQKSGIELASSIPNMGGQGSNLILK